MQNEYDHDIRILQLYFIGKIIAGFTHEAKNYLAVIKESSGLIEDMITFRKPLESTSDQYLEMTRSIEEQIEKTNSLLRYLNRFAHRMDKELSSFNVNESIDELLGLLTRFANQKKITLAKDFREDIPSISGNPSLLQFAIFSLLDEGFSRLDKNSRIILQTSAAGNTVQVKILLEGNFSEQESSAPAIPFQMLENILQKIRGSITREADRETLIMLPLNAS